MIINDFRLMTDLEILFHFKNVGKIKQHYKTIFKNIDITAYMVYLWTSKTLTIVGWGDDEDKLLRSIYTILNHEVIEYILVQYNIMPCLSWLDRASPNSKFELVCQYHKFLHKLDEIMYHEWEI